MNPCDFDIDIDLFDVFGKDYNRFSFPANIFRVTSGHGGESLLIVGTEKTALYDCGMAYCGKSTVKNIEETLARLYAEGKVRQPKLDYILFSHSHYDHIGALPYILDRYPDVICCGSAKCKSVLCRENAIKLIAELGTEARDLYTPGNTEPVRTDGFRVDLVLRDGDSISLGWETIKAYETKGHTDCSLSFYLQPAGILFTSESTGILEGQDYVHTPSLKSFPDSIESSYKCENLFPAYICLPHFGMIPQEYNKRYFALFREECQSKMDYIRQMMADGLNEDQMLKNYLLRYWTPAKEKEQPFEAFEINSKHILNALIRAVKEEGDVKYV